MWPVSFYFLILKVSYVVKLPHILCHSSNGNGIYIDGTLTHGKTERCLTFDNEPLTEAKDFTIKTLECWGFDL